MSLTKKDIILAAICGLSVSWIAFDFLGKIGLIFVIIFPILSIIGLCLLDLIGRKFLFVRQLGKFALAGAFADVFDIKIFQLIFLFLPYSLFVKAISFIFATFIKYFSDKYWTFSARGGSAWGGEKIHIEMIKFFAVAVLGLLINVASFYFFSKINIGATAKIWQEASIIFAALVTAIWNFCGYKFLVFKK